MRRLVGLTHEFLDDGRVGNWRGVSPGAAASQSSIPIRLDRPLYQTINERKDLQIAVEFVLVTAAPVIRAGQFSCSSSLHPVGR